ncbi:MAG: hypothetical protein K940chlam7_02018 [Chlamydiae bacterium]|nr:hypothetical protein [Chlamydiota bacterium]
MKMPCFEGSDDPRPAFIEALLEVVPHQRSIVVYYAPCESTRLKELARNFPRYTLAVLHKFFSTKTNIDILFLF